MKKFIHEIHRRSLWQVLGIYLVTGWIVLGAVGTLADSLKLPDWASPMALFLLIIGLPIVLATAFVQEGVGRREAKDVENVEGVGESEPEVQGAHHRLFTWRNAILGGVFAFSLLFGFAGLYVVIQDRGRSFAPQEAMAEEADPGIAFMPFTVSGSGLEHLREGMVTLLYASLDGAAGLRAISDRTVLAQWDRLVGNDQRADRETELSVAAATGASYAFLGSVVAVGPHLQLLGDIYELPDGTSLGRVQAEGSTDSLLALVEDLAIETLRTLAQAGVETVPRANLTGATTHSLPALTAYLEGEADFRRGEFEASIPHFEAALEADSTFALAHYRIAGAIGWTDAGDQADLDEHVAAALAGNLPSRERLLARGAGLEWGALEDLEEMVRRHPDDAEAWYAVGDLLYHGGRTELSGWRERAKAALSRASELDPGFAPYMIHLIDFAFNGRDAGEAKHWVEQYGRASPGSAFHREHRLLYRLVFEPPEEPLAFDAAIDSLARKGPLTHAYLLGHPRASDIGIALHFRRAEETGELDGDICFRYSLAEGRWRDFLTYAADPRLEPGMRQVCLFGAYMHDLPVRTQLLDAAMPHTTAQVAEWPSYSDYPEIWAGAWAAARGRWDEYELMLASLRAKPDQATNVPILEGYGQWQAGNPAQARETLESAPQWPPVRFWLGQINLELSRPDVAARYFSSFFDVGMPWTRSLYYLGLAYEEMGEQQRAQEAYAEYLDIWKDADPELEPLKQQARDALVRLGPLDQ